MNTVIEHIKYLISRTDCVIIPSIGTLLAHYEPAHINPVDQSFMPPRRVFTFNSALTASDGTLAYSISKAENTSIEISTQKVKEETEAMRRQLLSTGEVSLGQLGTIKLDSESGAPIFVDFGADKYSVATTWLPAVSILNEEQKAGEMTIKPKVSPFVKAWRVAASIAVLIGVGILASTPIAVDDAALASMAPEIKVTTIEKLMPSSEIIDNANTLRITNSKSETCCIEASESQASAHTLGYPHNALNVDGEYLTVIGSFASETEAIYYINQNPAQRFGIAQSKGYVRVYTGAYATAAEAYEAISNMETPTPIWVCKR